MLHFEVTCSLLFLFILPPPHIGALRSKGELRDDGESWEGAWFPYNPKNHITTSLPTKYVQQQQQQPHKQVTSDCDDGIHSIEVDFDPNDKRTSYNYLCLANTTERNQFEPNLDIEALQTFNLILPAFGATAKCLNETINYELDVPTYGSYRPVAPTYGKYLYLPPERWMRNLAEGAIVMLYHPCANVGQVMILQNILKSCLYRHIVTPSQHLSAERPLALLAWGKSLKLSVVDEKMVVHFIREHAKLGGPLSYGRDVDNQFEYRAALIEEARLITNTEDTEVCGYKET